jgi:radical SAM superfamily enzyme YgiQ (UPF0313 family)
VVRRLGDRLFPRPEIREASGPAPGTPPERWYRSHLRSVGLDLEQEKKRGLFAYLDRCLPPAAAPRYRPLSIAFIQAGPGSLRLPDGSRTVQQEMWDFLPSIQGTAGALLGALEADAAVNLGIAHRSLRAFADEFERLGVEQLQRMVRESDVVLISGQYHTWQRARELAGILKENNPLVVVVAGGPYATLNPEDALVEGVDYLVRYDGCVSACGLIRAISAGLEAEELSGYLEQLPNLFFRNRESKKIVRTSRMKVNARSGAPLPPVVGTGFYSRSFRDRIRILSLGATTGCPHRCGMCSSCRISSLARRPPEHVVADLRLMRQLGELEPAAADDTHNITRYAMGQLLHSLGGGEPARYNNREIFFWDDNLTHSKNREYAIEVFRAMADFFREEGMRPTVSWLQVGIDFFESDALLQAAREAGVRRAACGFETISANALRLMGKKRVRYEDVREQYRRAVRAAHARDIAVHAYLMVGFNEEQEDVAAMARFFQEIGVSTMQVLFQGCWSKKWIALDIPEVKKQPLADFDRLLEEGKIPAYLFDEQGRLIETLMTAGLVPTIRPEKMDYETLFRLRRRVYEEFYSLQNMLEIARKRDAYPDWATTLGVRLMARYRYLSKLDAFTERFEVLRKLRRADAEYLERTAGHPERRASHRARGKRSRATRSGDVVCEGEGPFQPK